MSTDPNHSKSRFRQVAAAWLLLAGLILTLPAFAATQGERGSSSTARLKITLIIPPKGAREESRIATSGHKALEGFCRRPGDFEGGRTGFVARLGDLSASRKADTDQLLRAHCDGRRVAAPVKANKASQDPVTVVIEPV